MFEQDDKSKTFWHEIPAGQDIECLYDKCGECKGTGIKIRDNSPCTHFISCPCKKCRPIF